MSRFFLDTEFNEDGKSTELISIGIYCEDGRSFYGQSIEFNCYRPDPWVKEHVLPWLELCPYTSKRGHDSLAILGCQMSDHGFVGGSCKLWDGTKCECPWYQRRQLKEEVQKFINAGKGKPQIYTWFGAYDHVVLCQLFGKMSALPQGWPMYTRDLKYLADILGNPRIPEQQEGKHHALYDARHLALIYQFLYANAQNL